MYICYKQHCTQGRRETGLELKTIHIAYNILLYRHGENDCSRELLKLAIY